MSILSSIFGIFRRKEEPPKASLPSLTSVTETITMDNVKSKMDLVLTQLDSIKTEYQVLNERLTSIERMVKEIYDMAKS